MNLRSALLALSGLCLSAGVVTAASPFRLFEVYAVRIVDDHGTPIYDRGRLNARGEFIHDIFAQMTPGAAAPAEAMNQTLLPFAVFPGYDALGVEALANFKLGATFQIDGQSFWSLSVSDQPKLDIGALVNISARGVITPGGEPLIGGFVIEDHPRRILIRGVGPALAGLGVTVPLANPMITVFRRGEANGFAVNDDWDQQSDAAEVETTAAAVGAFPLPHSSKDAALVLELPPGIYTAHLSTADVTGGTALLEIYIVP